MKSRRDHNNSLSKTSSENKNKALSLIKNTNPKKIENDERSSDAIVRSIKEPLQILHSKSHQREKWRKNKNGFPLYILPKPIQDLTLESYQKANYPLEFSCCSSLFALSIAIGNKYHIQLKEGFTQNASLYMVMIARAGSVKSHPLKQFVKPILNLDNKAFREYQKELDQYEIELSMSSAEKKEQGIEVASRPIFKQQLLNDYTIEALLKAHKFNRKGLGLAIDEFMNWINKFERYNNSTQEQDFLTFWNGEDYLVNRVNEEPLRIDKTFISVVGTTQSKLIKKAFQHKVSSGLVDRILICEPKSLKKEAWNRLLIDKNIYDNYEKYIQSIAKLEVNIAANNEVEPALLKFTNKAFDAAIEWNETITQIANNEHLDNIKQIYPKLDLYFLRFCLILQVSKYYANETKVLEIELETVKDAIDLVDYFKTNAISFRKSINKSDPIENLTEIKKLIFESLPEEFETKDAVAEAKNFGLSERAVKQFIKNRDFFKKVEHGRYTKL